MASCPSNFVHIRNPWEVASCVKGITGVVLTAWASSGFLGLDVGRT